jgi:hypothetical protein
METEIKMNDHVILKPSYSHWQVKNVDYNYDTDGKYFICNGFGLTRWVKPSEIEVKNPKFSFGEEVIFREQRDGDDFAMVCVFVLGFHWNINERCYMYFMSNNKWYSEDKILDVCSFGECQKDKEPNLASNPDKSDKLAGELDKINAPMTMLFRLLFTDLQHVLSKYNARIEVGKDCKLRLRIRVNDYDRCFKGPKAIRDVTDYTSFREDLPFE